jgi:hypothetical protein
MGDLFWPRHAGRAGQRYPDCAWASALSCSCALRHPELSVDRSSRTSRGRTKDVAQLLVSLAHGRRVRAAAVVYDTAACAVELRVAGSICSVRPTVRSTVSLRCWRN